MKTLVHGTAVSALCGLALGLALHGSWRDSHAGGPRLLLSPAQAAEPDHPAVEADAAESAPTEPALAFQDASVNAPLDDTPLPVDPLPVTRLTRRGGPPLAAAAARVERVASLDAEGESGVMTVGDVPQDAAAPTRDGGR
jgi:hypothetical protein